MCTVVTLPSHQLSSFLSSLPSPFPFLFHAQWKCLVRCPPFQKLFHPCLHSFKNCFLHPPSVLVFICAGPLDLPRLKKKRQRKPATASFTCFFSPVFSLIFCLLFISFIIIFVIIIITLAISFLIKYFFLFAILNTTGEARGKGRGIQSILLLSVQNQTHTRNKFSPSQKRMRGFLPEPKKMIK